VLFCPAFSPYSKFVIILFGIPPNLALATLHITAWDYYVKPDSLDLFAGGLEPIDTPRAVGSGERSDQGFRVGSTNSWSWAGLVKGSIN